MSNFLAKKYENHQIILASGSPRRQELLKGLDIPFKIETKEVDEVYPLDLKKQEITEYLAKLKSDAFSDLSDKSIVITSDTIVWLNGKAVMKPKDRGEAIQMLSQLSDNCHRVFTSVCIKSNTKNVVFSDVTKVCFNKLSKKEIVYYVDTYKPYDKAGAYGAQDWIGYIAINKLEGTYYNVMGLPVHKLYKELLDF
jgi:septum formation protein